MNEPQNQRKKWIRRIVLGILLIGLGFLIHYIGSSLGYALAEKLGTAK